MGKDSSRLVMSSESTVLDALRSAHGILSIGIGGGGDVAGALVVSQAIADLGPRASCFIGGISWERRTFDPLAGPRAICEVRNGRALNQYAVFATPTTSGPEGILFSEARASAFLQGQPVALVDPGDGPAMAATGIIAAASSLGCDCVVLVDVGGDALATGHEGNLVSPIGDAIMLATTPWVEQEGLTVITAVLGLGCDGELSVDEGLARLARVDAVAGKHPRLPIPEKQLHLLMTAAEFIGSEATAMAISCALGNRGERLIRGGDQVAQLTPAGAEIHLLDARTTFQTAAPLAKAVSHSQSVEEAHEILVRHGIRITGLGYTGMVWVAPRARTSWRLSSSHDDPIVDHKGDRAHVIAKMIKP